MQLRPRHGHASDYTPSELAEMLVDPYDDSPKCKLPSTCISGHFLKLNIPRTRRFTRYEGHHRGRLWGHPPSRLGEPVVTLQAHRVSYETRRPRLYVTSCSFISNLAIAGRTGAKVASKRPVLRLTAAVRYLATAPTPTFSRYLHFPTRGVVFLLAVFWTFVLGKRPLKLRPHSHSHPY